ncbi:MAG: ABC transporter ATP-binding protein [Clostridia bacterium]
MSVAIRVDNLTKSYGGHKVIEKISFEVAEGEIFALLGANGAGKTTTLECIEGIRGYEEGTIEVKGKLGVQLQSSSLPENITAREAFKLFCKWNKVAENMELFANFGLAELQNKQYKAMSTGQKRRLHLALALINNADIIFLDEPTSGLDVEGRVSLHKYIRGLREQGKTLIMASHDMAEVESLCDKIIILKDGVIAFSGTAAELTSSYLSKSKIQLKTKMPLAKQDFLYSTYMGMQQGYITVQAVEIGDALLELLNHLKASQNEVLDLKIERASLEQRFMEIATEVKE